MRESFKHSYKSENKDTVSLSVYSVGFQQCDSLHKWGTGIRDHYLIHHIISGKGYYKTGDNIFELIAGNTFIIYPNTEVSYWADSENPWEYYWIGFDGSDAGLIIKNTDFSKENPVISTDFKDELKNSFLDIYNTRGNSDSQIIRMTGYLYIALSILVKKSTSINKNDNGAFYAHKAIQYIIYNYSRQINVTDIADNVGISRSQLYRIFKENFSVSPVEYLSDFRIKQACQLLKTTSLSINVIANSVGFSDYMYFSKVFHKKIGVSPSKYIKKNND